MQFERELAAALEAARLAGEALRDEYARFQRVPDAAPSITTDADRRSQEIILQLLHREFPTDALCAEESTPTLAGVPQTGPRQWVVDPIDGTQGFALKNDEFSVMIGLVQGEQIILGVVLEPALGRLTYAVRGGGCWRREGTDTAPQPCRASATSELAHATLAKSWSRDPRKPSPLAAALGVANVRQTHSAGIKLALVARGEADVYVNTYSAFHDWDICAGHILVEEAGGRVTGLRGEQLHYGRPGAWQRQRLLATNGRLHDAAIKALEGVKL
jgi:3'(2'), 5'-bisphosphate nucleotidase